MSRKQLQLLSNLQLLQARINNTAKSKDIDAELDRRSARK